MLKFVDSLVNPDDLEMVVEFTAGILNLACHFVSQLAQAGRTRAVWQHEHQRITRLHERRTNA